MDNLTPTFCLAFSLKASGYYLIVGTSLALLGVACLSPTSEQDCVLSFHGRVHYLYLFLSLREDQHTVFWDIGLPCQSLTTLSGHSFVVVLQTPWRLCYSVSCHPLPHLHYPIGTTLSPPLVVLHHPSLIGFPTSAIFYRL